MAQSRTMAAYSAMVLAASLWGFLGLFSRNLDEAGFTPMEVTYLRFMLCTVALLAVMLLIDRKSLRIKVRDLWLFIICGVFKILIDLLLFESQLRIPLALATTIQFTSPYFVLLFSIFMFGEKVTLQKLAAIVIAFIGCVLVTGALSGDLDFDTFGILLALISGISYAAFIVVTKLFLDRGYSENTTLFYIFLFGTLLCTPFTDAIGVFDKFTSFDPVFNILVLGLLLTLVPYYLNAYALKYGNPVKVSITGPLEAVAAAHAAIALYAAT
ncbi:MAG: DMT family transporter [archaeon]|nr:DMT family transporter [archaeon]